MQVNKERLEIQQEAANSLQAASFNGLCLLPTGTGKALVLIECLKRINPKGRIWYLCDSETNRDETFKNELVKWGAGDYIEKIEFMCYQTAFRLKNEQVEVCLCDEFDFALTPKYKKAVTKNKFKHIVAVTATLTDAQREIAEDIVPIVYEMDLQNVEDKGLLNKTKYYLVNFLLTPQENLAYLNYNRTFAELLKETKPNHNRLEFLKIQRGQFLSRLASSAKVCRALANKLLKDEKARLIIFCGLSEQADRVSAYSYHSKSEKNWMEAFENGEINVAAVVGKINRGANIGSKGRGKPINRIIFEAPTKSATKFLQRSGRGRRLDVDSVLHVYFLIPYYKNKKGKVEPTVVKRWVMDSTKSIDFQPETFIL